MKRFEARRGIEMEQLGGMEMKANVTPNGNGIEMKVTATSAEAMEGAVGLARQLIRGKCFSLSLALLDSSCLVM